MALPFFNWSRVAASNATADATVNWQEGQAPSSVNDSARAMMASTAAFRDDISGAIVTGGTSTAYTVTSYQVFDTLAHLNNQIIAFTPHATNGATVTLNVDGLGAKPLRSAPSTELIAGTLIQGTPYAAVYNNSDAAFYLHGFYGNPYNIPVGGSLQYWGSTTPNSSFAFMRGALLSRTTYATLFAIVATTYGAGDGSTTFAVPDLRGRVPAGADDVGNSNRLTGTYFGADSHTLGATGGSESHTLTTGEMPAHSHANTLTDPGHAHSYTKPNTTGNSGGGGVFGNNPIGDTTGSSTTGITINNASAGSSNPHAIVQPTIICNYIMRII